MSNLNKMSIPKDVFENLFFQNGGEKYKQMTDQFMFEVPEHMENEANSEIEKDEYVQTQGTVKKAIGETHENGGIKTVLDEGDKVLSAHLKIGAEMAKKLSKEYEIKIKATDTYAKVLDKYLKKIGHTEATEEAEKYMKMLDKQKDKVKDETTLALNQQILMDEIKEYGDKINELEIPKQEMFSLLFRMQEDSKKKSGINNEVGKMQYGGEQQKERLKDFYNQAVTLGYQGDLNLSGDLGQEAGKLQRFMVEKAPKAILSYFKDSGQPMTAKGVDILKQKNKDAFTKAGISTNKDSAEYTPEEKAKLAEIAKVDDNFWLEQFQDNKWDWRYPATTSVVSEQPSTVDNSIKAPLPNLASFPQEQSEPQIPTQTKESSVNRASNFLLTPGRQLLNPSFLAPMKFQPRIYSGERVEISPEQTLSEINRSKQATQQQLDQLPDAQRAATLASMDASNSQAISKVLSETSRYNAQARERESYEEAQAKTRQSVADAQAAAQYQQLMGRELEGFERDLQAQNNIRFQDQFQKWLYINQMNRNNQLSPDIWFDGQTYQVSPQALQTQQERLTRMSTEQSQSLPQENKTKNRRKRFV